MKNIYLDNASTTQIDKRVADKVYEVMMNCYGNPSSSHMKGVQAYKIIDESRQSVAELLSCLSGNVIFTSGGTESNNIAVLGCVDIKAANKKNVVTSSVEHSSVMDNMMRLQSIGFDVRYVKPDQNGNINPEDVWRLIDDQTVFVSIMHVNNETGNIHDIKQICKGVRYKNKNTIIHCDGVQAFGKIQVDVIDLDVDLYSFSGHKIHAPKGIGGLYIKNNVRVKPLIIGGQQEFGYRGGTENFLGIVGIGEACKIIDIDKQSKYVKFLYDLLKDEISKINEVHINSYGNVLPYIFNFSIEGFKSETVLNKLQEKLIYVSSGSACSKGRKSRTLKGMGIADKYIDSAIRVGLSHYNTENDILIFIDEIKNLKLIH